MESQRIAVILSLLQAHRDHASVQELGCCQLAKLATNAENRVSIANAGGIAAILSGMKARIYHAGIQEEGCRALGYLALDNDDNKVSIAKAGGIVSIVTGMKAHRDHAGVWSKDQTEAIRPRKMSGKPNN